jgi:hypothetical protein
MSIRREMRCCHDPKKASNETYTVGFAHRLHPAPPIAVTRLPVSTITIIPLTVIKIHAIIRYVRLAKSSTVTSTSLLLCELRVLCVKIPPYTHNPRLHIADSPTPSLFFHTQQRSRAHHHLRLPSPLCFPARLARHVEQGSSPDACVHKPFRCNTYQPSRTH